MPGSASAEHQRDPLPNHALLDQAAPLRGAGPGVSAAAQPREARAAHAGPQPQGRIKTAHTARWPELRVAVVAPDCPVLATASRPPHGRRCAIGSAGAWTQRHP